MGDEHGPPRLNRRGAVLIAAGTLTVLTALYVLLPALAGLERTWSRVSTGDQWWLAAAAGLEALSFASYVVLFRTVFGDAGAEIGWRQSYRITMAGVVATRLFAAAGVGGVILTVWALSKRGLAPREIAARTATLLVLLYGFYMASLVLFGAGLRIGFLGEPAPFGLTVVPALFGATVIVVALAVALYARSLGSALERVEDASGTPARWARAIATVPAALRAGVRGALRLVLSRGLAALSVVGWWAFDIAVLYACLRAFGGDPAISVVVMAYFVGMAANTLPVPGGVGAVDGGNDRCADRLRGGQRARDRCRPQLSPVRVLAADDPRSDRLCPTRTGRTSARRLRLIWKA